MPNRILKESICTSESINALSDFQETFFYRLIVNCDDYGRMDARPAILKARLYPLRERLTLRDIQNALQALADAGCVEVYEVDGKPYLCLPSWGVHQQIRSKKSKFPSPDNSCKQMISNDIKCPRNPIQSESESKDKSSSTLCSDIISYLNEKAGTSYKATTEKTRTLISARSKEGFTLDDFRKVIDTKVSEWAKDEKMQKYIRPETLFGTKFEGYLNQVSPGKQGYQQPIKTSYNLENIKKRFSEFDD